MIPFSKDPSLNEWERALCAAIHRSRTFVSNRDRLAQEELKDQREADFPWNLRKGRTRNYVTKIFEEERVEIHSNHAPTIDIITTPDFVFEEPCLPSIIVATTLLWSCADYWNGLLPEIDRLKHTHFRPLNEYDLAWVAVLMNRTSAFTLGGITYSLLPFMMKVASLAGIQISARAPISTPDEWHISGVGRQFIPQEHVLNSIRDVPSSVTALSEELVYRSGKFYSGFFSQGLPLREIFEIAVASYLALPKTGDLREAMKPLHSITGKEIIKFGSDLRYKY